MLAMALAAALSFPFTVHNASEVVASVPLHAPGCDWSASGREAALADIYLDGKLEQNVMVFGSDEPKAHNIFLGRLSAGQHQLTVKRNDRFSAPACTSIEKGNAEFATHEYVASDPMYAAVANAPVLYARKNTVGKFTDIPLIVYAEHISDAGTPGLQYTVIFSNEDGGTNTRALMARWGRTTDIEYVYRGPLAPDGSVSRAIIQGDGHKDIEYTGKHEGSHPALIPTTDNNMVGNSATSAIRYQIAPELGDGSQHAREFYMQPWTYSVMAKELIREGKLRPYGVIDGDKISDQRNYVYIDYHVKNEQSAVNVNVRVRNNPVVYSSSIGRLDYTIWRSGWVQTTIELPPGTKPSDIEEVTFECLVAPPEKDHEIAHSGTCHVGGAFAFMLGDDYVALPSFKLDVNRSFPSGQSIAIAPGR